MHRAQAKVILDSVSPEGIRLTTVQVRFWRPMLPELNTHRAISKNAGSSRARPSKAIIDQVRNDPWGPIHWGKNQAGMQAREELPTDDKYEAVDSWRAAAYEAADYAEYILGIGVHKQIVNRLLEPFTYVDVLLTATDWANFFALRLHEDAQPEMQDLAQAIKDAMDASVPTLLQPGEWHLPYVTDEDRREALATFSVASGWAIDRLKRLSVSRNAKISYTAFDGTVEPIEKELDRFRRLIESEPMHSSPAEHPATPDERNADGSWKNPHRHGNLTGWIQLRKTLPNEYVPG
jgi:hypothetical protein